MRLHSRSWVLLPLAFACLPLLGEPGTRTPREEAWAVLNGGLAQQKSTRRAEAVRALSLLAGNRSAVKLALDALADNNEEVRTAAAVTLGQLRAESAIPALRDALSDKDISVVLAASQSLYLMHDKSAYAIYYAILMGDKKANDGFIESQLDRLKDPKKVALLGIQQGIGIVPYGGIGMEAYRAARSDNSSARAAAARFLALDPDPMSGDALVQIALADNSTVVRQAALDAIAERGNAACVERLQKNLSDDKYAVRYRTAATIVHLTEPNRKAARKKGSQSLQLK